MQGKLANKEQAMTAIRLSARVNEKHQLIVTLPDDVPVGPVEVLLQPVQTPVEPIAETDSERERIRAKLLAADFLVNPESLGIPPDVKPLPLEERLKIGQMPPGAKPVEMLVDEDRGDW
jgi:hypothetical protein